MERWQLSQNQRKMLKHFSLSRGGAEIREKKHKKHIHRKECEICNKVYKGRRGLALHQAKTHYKKEVSPRDYHPSESLMSP